MNSLQKNTTWKLVSLPPGRKLVQCKWVFQTKVAAYGSTWKYKGRLVAKGFSQVQGVDYHDTFAPVAKMDSICLVLAISASKHWEVHHMDVKSAFLHGYIHEEIYMKYIEVYITDPSLVCKLKKSLYGLKQAPREWYSRWMPSFSHKTSKGVNQIRMCIYRSMMVIFLLFFYIFMNYWL